MNKSRVDSDHRIELPGSQPGDVFEIREQLNGSYLLVRLEKRAGTKRKTAEEILQAMEESPLTFSMTWEELRKITREP